MAVLDLKDAYYSVPINPQHRKYLRFEFKDTHLLQLLRSQPLEIKMLKSRAHTPIPTRGSSPLVPQTSISWLSCVRASLVAQGVEGEPLNIILDSWLKGTRKQYQTYVTAWLKFYKATSISYIHPTLQQVLDFFTHQSKTVGYSAVATARSALSSFITVNGITLGEHPLVSRFMSGLFNRKPCRRITALHRNMGSPNCTQLPQNFSSF